MFKTGQDYTHNFEARERQMGNKSTRERQWETKRRVNDSWRLFAPELQLVETLHCATMSAVGPKP